MPTIAKPKVSPPPVKKDIIAKLKALV